MFLRLKRELHGAARTARRHRAPRVCWPLLTALFVSVAAARLGAETPAAGSSSSVSTSSPTPSPSPSPSPKNAASSPPAVRISFLPPPLENATFSVGLFDGRTGRLVRRLHEFTPGSAFNAGLNGFITSWDRRDDAGNPVPPGKYTAHGWAVGALKVEGVDVLGNEWVDEDEDFRVKRVEAIGLVPADDGLVAVCRMTDGSVELARFGPPGRSDLLWRKKIVPAGRAPNAPTESPSSPAAAASSPFPWMLSVTKDTIQLSGQSFSLVDGSPKPASAGKNEQVAAAQTPTGKVSLGRNETVWTIDESGLGQRSLSGEVIRQLALTPGEPVPRAVSASEARDRLYLLEEGDGWQRVRGLEWVDTRQEAGGQMVSEWKTFFERSIRRPDPALGLENPSAAAGKAPPPSASATVELSLKKNPLLGRGKSATAKVKAGFDEKGSYLESADGLRLRKISERPHLVAVKLVKAAANPPAVAEKEKDKAAATSAPTAAASPGAGGGGGSGAGAKNALMFYQTDGAAWDVFSITGANAMMAFDAGDFELTPTGEKVPEGEPKEPRDL